MLVGTAMTGLLFCPANTEANAPSIPATATTALDLRISGKASIKRWIPETPIS